MRNMLRPFSSRELLDTYEAQVVRALGQIDQTLRLVKFWPERLTGSHTLADLKRIGLLPPDLLFTVSIADVNGVNPGEHPLHSRTVPLPIRTPSASNAPSDFFFIGTLPRGPTGDAKLQFSRRLNDSNGSV